MKNKINKVTFVGEETSSFSWLQALKVRVDSTIGVTFLISEIYDSEDVVGSTPRETSCLAVHGLDPYPKLIIGAGEVEIWNADFDDVIEIRKDRRLIGIEYTCREKTILGCYTNLGSYYVNFSTSPEVCARMKDYYEIR
ncbi:MAG: hypothetical protein AAF496_10080 [Pseudomonadota bacterium]